MKRVIETCPKCFGERVGQFVGDADCSYFIFVCPLDTCKVKWMHLAKQDEQ